MCLAYGYAGRIGLKNIVLIPAAGVGARFGAGKPKQYVEIGGKTVLQHTLDIFLRHRSIDHIAVVLSPEDAFFQTASIEKTSILKCGGETRAETVRNGIDALFAAGLVEEGDRILVHDAARCCLPSEALDRLLAVASESVDGAVLAVPVADTLKRADSAGCVEMTVSRQALWQAQTPQLFPAGLLRRALAVPDLSSVTDEASAVEALGVRPLLVLGDSRNLKLTLPQDELIVRLLLAQNA
ncbi:2-C-methyl-D-erythritol 4-phosphate cytidylyltransferase [Neisseria weaveri]|nr:2-C-methyl-D-erythritol 4-phosphate cytidylyltransferase [Neisseria weaveri]